MGLAISKKYADMLGGTITVESTINVGSEFTLILPTQPNFSISCSDQTSINSDKVEKMRGSTLSKLHLSEQKILVVEDNDSAIIQIRDLLQSIGLSSFDCA